MALRELYHLPTVPDAPPLVLSSRGTVRCLSFAGSCCFPYPQLCAVPVLLQLIAWGDLVALGPALYWGSVSILVELTNVSALC